jgi:hypothetical protein
MRNRDTQLPLPQGGSAAKPRVAPWLPWGNSIIEDQPQRGCAPSSPTAKSVACHRRNPVRVQRVFALPPRVAKAQPWALGRNRVAVRAYPRCRKDKRIRKHVSVRLRSRIRMPNVRNSQCSSFEDRFQIFQSRFQIAKSCRVVEL